MNKIFIIIKREYLARVKKRSFIILTLLIPFLLIGFAALMGSIASSKSEKKTIAVVDESQLFAPKLKNNENVDYIMFQGNADSLKHHLDKDKYDALLHIPTFDISQKDINFNLYYNEQVGIVTEKTIDDNLNSILMDARMTKAGINNDQLKFLQSESIHISSIKDGKESSNGISIAIGTGCGFLLYMFMLFYGMSVMRSVMEEKTNRIAEIIVSSVKPFELMMGKIIGVALVGLTQVLFWVLLIFVCSTLGAPILLGNMHLSMDPTAMNQAMQPNNNENIKLVINSFLHGPNWIVIILWFLFYFLGGYFLYAALFASVGSLVNEDPQESSQYTLPITLPIILGFVIMSKAISDPNSPLAIFGSLFPLTSPIVMMARIPFGDVPAWQLITSAALLILGFLFTTWMAGKIYRTGILMYGKKISLKEVGKWVVRR